MLAAIDVGNSNVALGLFDGDALTHNWRITTRRTMTTDECEIAVAALLSKDGIPAADVDRCVLSSVVPSLTHPFSAALEALCGSPPLVVTTDLSVGLTVSIDHPSELGTDLFANAVAGWKRFGGPCIVVDFGTALSVTAVDAGGAIRGVALAPGVNTALEALSGNTAQLPTVPLDGPADFIGTNTVASIQSGIMNGYRGLVTELVDGTKAELGGAAHVAATGGQATVMAPHCSCVDTIDQWLTLDGLRLIAEACRDTDRSEL